MTQNEIMGIIFLVIASLSWGVILGMYIEKWKK